MAELVDVLDLGSSGETRESSSLSFRTNVVVDPCVFYPTIYEVDLMVDVSVENTSAIGRRLTVNVPVERLQSEMLQLQQALKKNRQMAGFRPGKIPEKVLHQKFGTQIRQEAIGKVIESTLLAALQEKALEPVGRPEIEQIQGSDQPFQISDTALRYVVNFEVLPEIVLPDFSTLVVEECQVDITEADVRKALDKLRDQKATWDPVERKAQWGDTVIVDYTSLSEGKPYAGDHDAHIPVELGKKGFLAGIEEGLVGASAGDIIELDLQFPKDWHIEKLADKPVHFKISVKEVQEKQVPSLDEKFAKRIGTEASAIEAGVETAILAQVRKNLEKHLQYVIREKTKKDAMDKLVALTPLVLPKALLKREISALHEELHRKAHNHNTAHDACHHHHDGLEEEARHRVSLSLILGAVIKLENIHLDQTRVDQKISELAAAFGNAGFIEKMYYESKELLSGIQNTVLVEQAMDAILSKATINQKSITAEALLNPADHH